MGQDMVRNAISLFILTITVFVVFLPSYTQMQDLRQKSLEYGQRITQIAARNDQLREERRRLREDPVYLEKVAREKMGLIREGEVVYKFVPVSQSKDGE